MLLDLSEVTYGLCRYLFNNQITSLPSGAFTGLGNMKFLYVTMHSNVIKVIFSILLVQGNGQQPNYFDCQWRIHWTWKPGFLVYYQLLFFSIHGTNCVKLYRRMDTLPTTKAPFNMLSGTKLTQLYAACFAYAAHIFNREFC